MNVGTSQPVATQAPQPPGTVSTSISALKSILDRLNAKTERLATALAPILKPLPPATTSPCEGFNSECEVATGIAECLSTIQHIETVIEETIDRLDL